MSQSITLIREQEGAVCMHLLTSDGWDPKTTIEGILMQLRIAISVNTTSDPPGPPARLAAVKKRYDNKTDYPAEAAINGYLRVVQGHG
jgi:ubiquitin-protein ligase